MQFSKRVLQENKEKFLGIEIDAKVLFASHMS